MAKSAYPTTGELAARLVDYGVSTPPPSFDLQDQIDGAVEVAEDILGVVGIISEAGDNTYTYRANSGSRYLVFPSPFASITSVTIDGNLLTEGEDYVAQWEDHRRPSIERLRFGTALVGQKYDVEVVGKLGRWPDMETDLFNAILNLACVRILSSMEASGAIATGPVSETKQKDVTIKFAGSGTSSSESNSSKIEKMAKREILKYRRFGNGII